MTVRSRHLPSPAGLALAHPGAAGSPKTAGLFPGWGVKI